MTKLDFVTRTAALNAKGTLVAEKRKLPGQTITNMRQDLISRAQDTIKAFEGHKGRVLRAPMARSIHNGFEVKIGYGKGNVGFFEGKGDDRIAIIPAFQVQRSSKLVAIDYLQKFIAAVQAGEFDALLTKTLAEMTARFPSKQKAPPVDEQEDEPADEQEDNVVLFAGE